MNVDQRHMSDHMTHVLIVISPGRDYSSTKRGLKEPCSSCIFDRMSLTKIPFILLAAWGFHTSYTAPNPAAPQHERYPSSLRLPFENNGLLQWAPTISKVSNYILVEKFSKRPSDSSHNTFFALLRYPLSWHLRTLQYLYPN
jgi:hypothetical protein